MKVIVAGGTGFLGPTLCRNLGRDPVQDHASLTQSVGHFSQRFSLYGDLSIDETLAFFAEIHGVREHGARRDAGST